VFRIYEIEGGDGRIVSKFKRWIAVAVEGKDISIFATKDDKSI
jgi:hypothetical protein